MTRSRENPRPGSWRQDDLEPRIVLDGSGEFFAIAVSSREAARIVSAMNASRWIRSPRGGLNRRPEAIAGATAAGHPAAGGVGSG
jgi:hypothetical protein